MRLNGRQLRSLNEFLLELYATPPEELALERLVEELTKLIPATWFSADEVYAGTGRLEHRVGRNLEGMTGAVEGVRLYGHQNPIVESLHQTGFAPVSRISDFVTFREFSRTDYHQQVLAQLTGFRDQAALLTRMPGFLLGFTFNRERAFSDEERMMLELVQPHIERVLYRLLQYAQLPAVLPVTAREREVLHWLAEGKRDTEIGVILQISPRTVEQHVRALLQKLGVETRGGAIAAAWRARLTPPNLPNLTHAAAAGRVKSSSGD